MLNVFLDQISAAPLQNTDFTFEFTSWIANIVDSLNEDILLIQDNLGIAAVVQSATTTQITTAAPTAPNGAIWYCTDHIPPCPVMKVNGVLVQLQTAAFP